MQIQAVLDSGVALQLAELLIQPLRHAASSDLLSHALRLVGHLVSGDELQTQTMIDAGVLPALWRMLVDGHTRAVRKQALFAISNSLDTNTHTHIARIRSAQRLRKLGALLTLSAHWMFSRV